MTLNVAPPHLVQNGALDGSFKLRKSRSRLIYITLIHKTLIPDSLNIQMTSQMAITAITTYLIHCPTVLGSVRFSILLLYLHFVSSPQ
jgi:hypothetical protein